MSDTPVDTRDGAAVDAATLLARAATAADVGARRALAAAIDDFFIADEARLDERTRSALAALLRALVGAIETQLGEHGARLLEARDQAALAAALAGESAASVCARLTESGLLRDPDLMDELIARVRQDLIGAGLPATTPDDAERAGLLSRLVLHSDRVVAASAMAVLVADSRRRGADPAAPAVSELPAELHHRLVWWTAAALRERLAQAAGEALPALDRALSEAAQRSLAAHDEAERLESAAMRLAAAVDAPAGELPKLLTDALADRRLALFVALVAQAVGIGFEAARALVLDPSADRLWLVLRALGLTREAIAHIGYALCEADPRRDVEIFADRLDAIMAIDPAATQATLAPLRLDPDYRAAILALAQGKR